MRFDTIAPRGTFIGEYMHACSPLETALAYDFWCAVWALGTCLGRDVFIPRPHSPVHMNWYIMLVAESGITRKSTAVRLARDIVSDVLGIQHLVEGRSTPEHLFDRLVDMPHMAIAVSELVTFLGRESYVIELPAFLTDMYDCPPQRSGGTVTRGQRVIENAYLTFISASTPSWLVSAVNPNVIEGGFTSRCLFIHDEQPKKRVPWPVDVGTMSHARARLVEAIAEAQAVSRVELLPAAMRRFEGWYRGRDTVTDMPFLASFLSREDAHVLRLAACLCINDGTLAIDRRHMDVAIKCIMHAKAGALQVFSARGTTVRLAQGIDKIARLLLEAGGIGVGHTPLYASVRNYVSASDFKIVIEFMIELGMVQAVVERHHRERRGGPAPRRYVRTDHTARQDKLKALRQAVLG